MIPHTRAEDDSLSTDHYGIYAKVLISPNQGSRLIEGLPGVYNPATLLGYDPLLSAEITADLDQPCASAEFRFHMGLGSKSVSPHMLNGVRVGGRALFDPGNYIEFFTKCVALTPVLIPAKMPSVVSIGGFVASNDAITPPVPSHQKDDCQFLEVQSPNESVTLSDAQGFLEMAGSPVGTGTAGGGGGGAVTDAGHAENVAAANPQQITGFTPSATAKGIIVSFVHHTVGTDIVTGVTYGGVAMTRIATKVRATNNGRAYLYFLGSGIPTGAQTVSVARTEGTTIAHLAVQAVGGSANTEIVDSDTGAANNATPQLTLQHGGRICMDFACVESERNTLSQITDLAGQSRIEDHQFTAQLSVFSRTTTAGSSDTTIGWTTDSSDHWAMCAMAVAEVPASNTPTRQTWFWRRCTGSNMLAPTVAAGTGRAGRIYNVRDCILTGNPWDGTPQSSVQATPSANVIMPPLTVGPEQCLLMMSVSAGVKTTSPQVSWFSAPFDGTVRTERSDNWTQNGAGGGMSVATAPKVSPGVVPGGGVTIVATLATAAPQARFIFALKPRPTQEVLVNKADIPWRPVFYGRIDAAEPEVGDVVVVQARDMGAELLDTWIEPGPNGGWPVGDNEIDDHLRELPLVAWQSWGSPPGFGFNMPFVTVGVPTLFVPRYLVQPGSLLLAMRQAALQSGWDLRGRWGTSPFEDIDFVLTYYAPDRGVAGGVFVGDIAVISPNRYLKLTGLGKSREEVRNVVEVTPADPPRLPIKILDQTSIDTYGRRYLGVSEDATSFILSAAQAQALAEAILSDTKDPKVQAEIELRYFPFVEINDVIRLPPNKVHHDFSLLLAISGYTHHLSSTGEPGAGLSEGTTVLRTRDAPAAASREWRQITPKLQFTSTELPSGRAREGALWTTVES